MSNIFFKTFVFFSNQFLVVCCLLSYNVSSYMGRVKVQSRGKKKPLARGVVHILYPPGGPVKRHFMALDCSFYEAGDKARNLSRIPHYGLDCLPFW